MPNLELLDSLRAQAVSAEQAGDEAWEMGATDLAHVHWSHVVWCREQIREATDAH